MRKIAFFLVLLLVVSMPLSVQAAEPKLIIRPTLWFEGTTAHCEISMNADHTYDYLVVTMKLYQGNNLLKQWAKSSPGSVYMYETYPVTKGVTYTLTIEIMVNGTSHPSGSTTKTC